MLDPWIIEKLRQEEEAEKKLREERSRRLEIQIEEPTFDEGDNRGNREKPQPGHERGAAIIDYSVRPDERK